MLPNWTDTFYTLGSDRIHYVRSGGDKPPLVLAHGFSDNGMCWLRLARDLAADYDVILPDARGHGKSPRFVLDGAPTDPAADLAGLIRGLGLKNAIVGGHSMGASTSANFAAHYPDLLRALILEDPPWREPQPEPPAGQAPRSNPFADWLKSLEGKSVEQLVEICRKDSPTWAEDEWVPWAEGKQQLDPNVANIRPNFLMDWRETAKAIQCPTLMLVAEVEKGAIVSPATAAEAAALNPRIQVVAVPGAGHSIRRENFPAVRDAIRKFLAGL